MLRVSTIFTIVDEFMKQLKKRKLVWWKFYDEQHRQQSNFNIKLMQNQFANRNDMNNINSYRQIVLFNFISSIFQRFNQENQSSRSWQSQFLSKIDYNQNQQYRVNSSQYLNIDYRNQQRLENVDYQKYQNYQNYWQSISSSLFDQKQIVDSSQNDQRNAYDSSSNAKNQNSYRVNDQNQNQQNYFA